MIRRCDLYRLVVANHLTACPVSVVLVLVRGTRDSRVGRDSRYFVFAGASFGIVALAARRTTSSGHR
eukprot:2621362-Pleurochrysis_carterae.AAC.1